LILAIPVFMSGIMAAGVVRNNLVNERDTIYDPLTANRVMQLLLPFLIVGCTPFLCRVSA
jgi:hypothetical protein